jgi:ureidoglycolate lyase
VSAVVIKAEPLTTAAFAPFGEVIETAGHTPRLINAGTAERFDDLAPVDVLANGGRPLISIFKATPRPLPFTVTGLERHPLSSQAFYPLDRQPFLVVVAESVRAPWASRIRVFRASGQQGVSYRRNTWHHALLAIGQTCHFLVIDRGGPEENCDEVAVDPAIVVTTSV